VQTIFWPGGQNTVIGLNYVPASATSKAGHITTDMFVLKQNIFA